MWNYKKLSRRQSPMAEIIAKCSCIGNINLVIYHLSENHVECATVRDAEKFNLGETVRAIKADSRHDHAILAYDLRTRDVYKIEDVPELPVASAVLLCIVTELMNGQSKFSENQDSTPILEDELYKDATMPRGANGRFVKRESQFEDTKTKAVNDDEPIIGGHRFHLGRH